MRVVTDEDGLGGMDSPLFPLDPDLDARLVPRTPPLFGFPSLHYW